MDRVPAIAIAAALVLVAYLFYHVVVEALIRIFVPPKIEKKNPGPVWILLLAIGCGYAYRSCVEPAVRGAVTAPAVSRQAARLRDVAIIILVMVVAAHQPEMHLRISDPRFRYLIRPAFLGAFALNAGAVAGGLGIRAIASRSQAIADIWPLAARCIVANANGWTGDSTTLAPTLAILDDQGRFGIGAPVLLLDTTFGIAWFIVATVIAGRHRKPGTTLRPAATRPATTSNCIRLLIIAAVAVSATFLTRVLAERPILSHRLWHPFAYAAIIVTAAALGYVCGIGASSPGYRRRNTFLELAVGMIGVQVGLVTSFRVIAAVPLVIALCSACAVVSFVFHLSMLWWLRGKYDWGELFVASMCAVGGLGTAPTVAAEYSDDFIDRSYVTALCCNLLSIPLTFVAAFLLLPR